MQKGTDRLEGVPNSLKRGVAKKTVKRWGVLHRHVHKRRGRDGVRW